MAQNIQHIDAETAFKRISQHNPEFKYQWQNSKSDVSISPNNYEDDCIQYTDKGITYIKMWRKKSKEVETYSLLPNKD